jgi:Ca2+-binding RTX toxin-like protein
MAATGPTAYGEKVSDHLAGGFGDDKLYGGVECDPASSYGYGTVDKAPNQLVGGPGNDSLDNGPGSDRGQGGYHDRRADLVVSLETGTAC